VEVRAGDAGLVQRAGDAGLVQWSPRDVQPRSSPYRPLVPPRAKGALLARMGENSRKSAERESVVTGGEGAAADSFCI
jgi:hypothetical protein